MFGLKKHIIKSMIKMDVVNNLPGKLEIYVAQISQIEDEYKAYQHFAVDAIKLLKGVQNVSVNYETGILSIAYDNNVVSAQKIYAWLDTIIDIAIDHKDFIKDNWEKDVNMVWQKMQPILLKGLNQVNSKYK